MAIYHCSKSEVQRSKGQNAIEASAYISRSKLQLLITNNSTGERLTISYNFSSRKGLAHSIILAPDDAPAWVYNRQELWNKAESSETRKNAETARKLTIALPKELTLQQNIELIEDFAFECLVSHGMIADINIHYDNEDNPHVHIQMTTRRLLRSLENGEVVFGAKGRDWGRREFLYYYRENVANFINLYLEKHGHLDRVSHLSHKARGIDLIPAIHEGAAWYIKDSRRKLINKQILKENAAKIRANPELVFGKLSINKPVFTKEEIAIALSDVLSVNLKIGSDDVAMVESLRKLGQKCAQEHANGDVVVVQNSIIAKNVLDISSVDVEKNVLDNVNSNTTSATPTTVSVTNMTAVDSINSSTNTSIESDIEPLNQEYSTEFMLLYNKLLASEKISLVNPSDLLGRTLYALTKRIKLEQRFIGIVEELQHRQQHNLSIDDRVIDKLSIGKKLIANAVKVGIAVQEVVNDQLGLKYDLIEKQQEALTEEQRQAVIEILNGRDISVLQGYPGAGKTFVMREIVHQYKKVGYRVIGTAPSSSAAQVLASATGIESKNIALWRKEWQEAKGQKFELALRSDYYTEEQYQHQDFVATDFSQYCNNMGTNASTGLNNKTILIIDEASMIELANMDYLLSNILKSGAKAIIVGDNNQFTAVGMAGAFKKICAMSQVSKLTEVMRHKHQDPRIRELQRQATKLMGLYKMNEALGIYRQLGAFNIHKDVETTKEALVADYINEYLVQGRHLSRDDLTSIRSVVIGAYTNVAVNYFNIEVRKKLKQAGILKGLSGNFKSGAEMVELLRGEQIVFTSNKAEYKGFNGILNGEVATVIDFNQQDQFGHGIIKLLVHKADGSKKIVQIDTADPQYPVRFKHGYAVTGYKLQGETVDYMKVYYESVMGYEAFNVLMSRYKYDVQLYAAKDVLEDIVYKRLEEDVAAVRSRFTIEAYRKLQKKVKVPVWYIGLSLGIGRRVDNNLAIDYRQLDKLSPNEQVIKSYLEARRVVFDLRGKMQEWQERQETPIKLTRLYAAVSKSANVKMKNVREITIDPYGLILAFLPYLKMVRESLGESATEEEVRAVVKSALAKKAAEVELHKSSISKKIVWSELSRTEQNQHIWPHLSEYDLRELETIYEQLQKAKEKLEQHAKVICNNYHGSSSSEGVEEANSKDPVSMGDRIIQLNLNYQTIQRHAGYVTDKYFFKNINQGVTLVANSCWGQMMKICHGLNSIEHDNADSLNIFTTNLAGLNEFINETKLLLIENKALLQQTNVEHQQIKKELAEITDYREQLFPEFLSRIYKTPVPEVLQKWQELLVENKHQQLADAISKLKQNPKLLGDLKGVGFGKMLGINQSRKDAISNLAVIARRFKDYEQGSIKIQKLQDKLLARNYEKLVANLSGEVALLTESLPNKYEQSFLDQVNLLQKESKLSIENLTAIVKEDELQGLIYEYYNYINDEELARLAAPANIQGKNHQEITSSKIEDSSTKEGKVRDRTNKYNSINAVRKKRLDFNEVSKQLTEYNYRIIFEHYAPRINSDGKRFKRSGAEISLGSLSMNLRKGLWVRHSSGDRGNIFSFVQQALNCSKLEALEQVAAMSNISARENDCHNDNYRNNVPKLKMVEQENKQVVSINEWYAQPCVPEFAAKFDPNVHLAWMLKSNIIDGIYYYRNNRKQLIGLTVRLVSTQDGTKQVLPVSYCRNESLNKEAWRLKGFSDNSYKPIYNIEKIVDDQRTILIVEGEKTCDKAQELLSDYIVLSWLGGSNGADKANWQQLRGREVVIWPDHDGAGIKAARTIGQMINDANGYIGNVTIIDPSRLEFNGTIHANILPEKWDLADKLPVGLNIVNLKEVIKNCQQHNSSLSYTQAIAASLQQVLAEGQELAIGERILWQARSSGALRAIEQIKQEATREVSWQEKLSSPEAEYYTKYAENTGKGGSPHQFLRLQDALYRDTLVAIAVSSKIKDKESLELPGLIRELQGEYEQKQRALSHISTYCNFGDDEHYQSHVKSLESYGIDRVELYQTMVRDVSLLHQEQLSTRGGRIIRLQQKAIQQEIYRQITAYKVRQAKAQASSKLDYDDKVKIASKIYDNLCSHKWWQSLVVADLNHVHKLQQETQEKVLYLQEQATQQVNNLKKADTINKLQTQIQDVIAGLNGAKLLPQRINISKLQEKACLYGLSRINEQKVSSVSDHQIKALVARSLFEIKYEKEINDILQGIWYTDNDNMPMPVAHKIKCLVDASRITKMAGYVIEKMMIDNPEQDLQMQKLAGQIIIDAMQKYQTRRETIKLTLATDIVQKLASYGKKFQHNIAEQLVDHIWQNGSEQVTNEQFALMKKSATLEQQLIPLMKQQFQEELQQEASTNLPTHDQQLSKNIEASIGLAVSKIRNSIYSIASNNSDHTSQILLDSNEDVQELNPLSHKEYNKIIKQTIDHFNQAQEELRVEQNIQQDKQQQLRKNSMFLKL